MNHTWHWPQVLRAGHCEGAGRSAGPRGGQKARSFLEVSSGKAGGPHQDTCRSGSLGQTGACRDSLVSGPSLAVGAERALQHHETQNELQEFLPVALR